MKIKKICILWIAFLIILSGCAKVENQKETETDNVVKDEERVAVLEVLECETLGLYEAVYDEAAFKCDFTEKVVSYMSPVTYIYSLNNEESTKIGVMLPYNEAEILSSDEEWTYVKFGENSGYVKNSTVLFGPEALSVAKEKGRERIALSENADLYAEFDSKESIGPLYQYSKFEILSEINGMLYIEYDGNKAYIKSECVKETYDLTVAISIEEYQDRIAREEELKRQKEEEERQRIAREAAVKAGLEKYIPTVQGESFNLSEEDLWLLACVIKYESGWQEYEGKLAVANVVLNRYKTVGSISGVIYAKYQFSGVSDGYGGPSDYFRDYYLTKDLNYRLPDAHAEECMRAAIEANAGINNIGDFRFFIGVSIADFESYSDYKIIGGHCFYNY